MDESWSPHRLAVLTPWPRTFSACPSNKRTAAGGLPAPLAVSLTVPSRASLPTVDEEGTGLRANPRQSFQHPYPPTKLMFVPDEDGTRPDLLASSGDFLRLWRITDEGVALEKLLNNVRRG